MAGNKAGIRGAESRNKLGRESCKQYTQECPNTKFASTSIAHRSARIKLTSQGRDLIKAVTPLRS